MKNIKDSVELKEKHRRVAIRKGFPNRQYFCTGACQEIVGWRDKLPNEY